jgi:hypothetical protein
MECAAGRDQSGDLVDFAFGGAVCRRDRQSAFRGGLTLLGHMGQFVREELTAAGCAEFILPAAKRNIIADGIGARANRARGLRRRIIRVNAQEKS